MAQMNMIQALNSAMDIKLGQDPSVVVLGDKIVPSISGRPLSSPNHALPWSSPSDRNTWLARWEKGRPLTESDDTSQ